MKIKELVLSVFLLIINIFILFWFFKADVNATEEIQDTFCTEEQVRLCQRYGSKWNICPELLEALIEAESSGNNQAVNGTCYGICQINGSIWGYEYDTESEQVNKACKILLHYLYEEPDMAYALGKFNGQSSTESKYADGTILDSYYIQSILDRSYELEELHGKHNY